jgi:MoaA/NifB/PqqE/SkfB family radical SAM enzyme
VEQYADMLPRDGMFQVQLEGGEPTIHPQFWEFVRIAREHPGCTHLVLCTNGVVLPRTDDKLRNWLRRMGSPLTIKLSFNHHLLDHDPRLLKLAASLRDLCGELGGKRQLVINVRLRRGVQNDDSRVREAIEHAGLLPLANVFFLQRYGFASDQTEWEPPAPVWDNFTLVNPDGQTFGPDLIARSEAMRVLS